MRRIAGVKKVNKGRMQELTEEVGVKESLRKKLVRSWIKWAEHMDRMEGEGLTKRADMLRVKGRRRRGRPRWTWEDRFGRIGRRVENDSKGWGSGDR